MAFAQFSAKFLKFGNGPGDAVLADNADWLNSLNYIDFLRDIGRHFSVNRMLALISETAPGAPARVSFLEFNYMILQAYDSLSSTGGTCVLQMGGPTNGGTS